MRVQAGVPCRASQLLIVFVADMPASARVLVSLRQTKVDYIDYVLMIADTDQEVVWLDISV